MKSLPLIFSIIFATVLSSFLASCGDNQNVNVTVTSEAADGLDLKAVTALLKDVKDAEDLEERINSGDPRICNLDLNEDDVVDYVKVSEYSAGEIRGFSLTTDLGPDDVQELATIEVTKNGDSHKAQTHGNSQIYGSNHYYHRSYGVGDVILMSYLFSSHRPYRSGWGYGNYPSNYNRSAPVARDSYRSRMGTMNTGSVATSKAPAFKGSGASPNKSRTSSKIKAPLRNPTASQKSFQARNPSKALRSGGFGSRSGSGSFRSSSRSGSSFGGGK